MLRFTCRRKDSLDSLGSLVEGLTLFGEYYMINMRGILNKGFLFRPSNVLLMSYSAYPCLGSDLEASAT